MASRLALVLLSTVLYRVVKLESFGALDVLFTVVGLGVSVLTAVALLQLREALPRPEVAWVAAGLFAAAELLGLVIEGLHFASPQSLEPAALLQIISMVELALALAADGALLWALWLLGRERRAWVPPLAAALAVGTVVKTLLYGVLTLRLVPVELLLTWPFGVGRAALPLLIRSGMVALALAAQSRPSVASAEPTAAPAPGVPAARDLLVGAVMLVVGLGVTLLSYSTVSTSGGTYVVATGLIGVGLGRIIRGFIRLGRAPQTGG